MLRDHRLLTRILLALLIAAVVLIAPCVVLSSIKPPSMVRVAQTSVATTPTASPTPYIPYDRMGRMALALTIDSSCGKPPYSEPLVPKLGETYSQMVALLGFPRLYQTVDDTTQHYALWAFVDGITHDEDSSLECYPSFDGTFSASGYANQLGFSDAVGGADTVGICNYMAGSHGKVDWVGYDEYTNQPSRCTVIVA